MEARSDTDVQIVCYTCFLVRKTNRSISHLVPSAVSIWTPGAEQLYQVKALDWTNRQRVALDLFSNFKCVQASVNPTWTVSWQAEK